MPITIAMMMMIMMMMMMMMDCAFITIVGFPFPPPILLITRSVVLSVYINLYKSLRPGRDASEAVFGPSFSKTPRFTLFFAIFGSLRGASRARKVVENHAFYRVFRDFRYPSNLDVFSFAFSKKLRKPRVLPRFGGHKAAVRRLFFCRFRMLAF